MPQLLSDRRECERQALLLFLAWMQDDTGERDFYREHIQRMFAVDDDGFALADSVARFAAAAYTDPEFREECRKALLRMIERRTDWHDL